MSDVFKDKSASILLADPLSGVRPIMSAALRELGFNRVMSVDSVTEALNILAAEPVDWLITSLFPDGKVNGLQVLKLARQERRLQNLKVTFFLSEEERFVLSKAFALGLFTWHAKPFNKDQFSAEMAGVVKQLEANRWNRTLTSAEYLRPSLKSRSDHVALVQLEQALYQAFPEDLRLLLRLAEAHFLAGDSLRARTLLWQAEQRDSELTTEARAISDAFIGKALGAKDTNEWKALDLGVCVVVDPDETAQTGIKETLGTCGAKAVMTFANGGAAWEWLRGQPEPDVIVMEWRIPGVSGPALLQRIRSHGFHQVSVVVHSSLVHKKDAQLLKEMGVSEIVEKPFRRGDFLNCLAWTVGQAHRPTEGRMLEAKIRALLAGGDFASATNFMQLYVTKNDPQDPGRKQLEAEFAFASGDFASARDLASASVRLGNKSVTALNLLGKALMRLRDFKAALRIFEKANGISPNSVSRLCAIAETQQELGDGAAARRTLAEASTLDPDNQDVINASVNIGLASGDAALARGSLDRFRPSENVLAYINNRAIAHARAQEFDEGIKLYLNALQVLPDDKQHLRASVLYNLSLAYARKQDLAAAVKTLESIAPVEHAGLMRKVQSLLARARGATASGKDLQLFTDAAPAAPALVSDDTSKLIRQFKGVSPRDVTACCYGVHIDDRPEEDLVKALLATVPSFKTRDVIVKG